MKAVNPDFADRATLDVFINECKVLEADALHHDCEEHPVDPLVADDSLPVLNILTTNIAWAKQRFGSLITHSGKARKQPIAEKQQMLGLVLSGTESLYYFFLAA